MKRWNRVLARLRRVGLAVAEKVTVAVVTKVVFALLGLFLAWLGIAVELP